MKSSVESINSVQCRVTVELTPDEVNKAFDNAYRKLQRQAKIQGFRPGKAPLSVIRKLYGASVSAEVGDSLINTHLFSALKEKTIQPIAAPVLEKIDTPSHDKGFHFTALVDFMPAIEIADYKGVSVTGETFQIQDAMIEREIDNLRRRQARGTPIEGNVAAAAGHLATIGHSATLAGEPIPSMQVENADVGLGRGELFEDLEKAIIGMHIGDTKDVQITLPADYGEADLAGKTVQFTISLSGLKALELPPFDDEFAKDLNYESAALLRDNIRGYLEQRAEEVRRQKLETAILDKLIERHPFDVPPAMVDQVIDSMIQEMQHLNDEAKRQALADQNLRKSYLATAKRRTQNTLLLWHVHQKEKLAVTDAEVRDRTAATLNSMGMTDPKHLTRVRQNLEPRIRENLIFEKAINFLIDNATITDIPVSI